MTAARRWRRLLPILWLLAFALAAYGVLRPKPLPPAPTGWQRWLETGALYALLPEASSVWAGGSGGLWHVGPDRLTPVPVPGLPAESVIYTIARDAAGRLWLGHSNGLSVGSGGQWHHFTAADGLPPGPLLAIVLTEDGGWLGGSGGLLHFRGPPPWPPERRGRLVVDPLVPEAPVTALLRDSDGALWVGTSAAPRGGVYRLTDGKIRHWGAAEGLPHPRITSLLQDHRGRLWVGTGFLDRGGLARFAEADEGWRLEASFGAARLAGPKVRSLAEDGAGRLWVGSENDGLAVLAGDRRRARLGTADGLPGVEVTAIAPTADGALWLATLQGLARIRPATVSRLGGTGGER